MDILSTQFLSALAAIVVIDLVLAGDNAIVIALAARSLPAHLQRRAIIWGTGGAIVVRSLMTMGVVWLLKIPGLLLAGGVLLLWIAYGLLAPASHDGDSHGPAATTFWGAMKTIVIADAVMGLDNVLAVAGAAHGSYLLVVLGLLISVPIVIWGSTIVLKWVERFPVIVYIGAAVLAWTAAKMILHEPVVAPYLAQYPVVVPLVTLGALAVVLIGGFLRNHGHLESRITTRLAELKRQAEGSPRFSLTSAAGVVMHRVLLPVDGSINSQAAVRHVVRRFIEDSSMEVHLLNVQPPLSRHVARVIRRSDRESWHNEEADKAMQPARELLERHGVPHATHAKVGDKATVIADEARRLRCDQIVMGTARRKSLTRMLQDSTTAKVLELTQVPVEVITGNGVSGLEKWGIPASVGALIAFLIAVSD